MKATRRRLTNSPKRATNEVTVELTFARTVRRVKKSTNEATETKGDKDTHLPVAEGETRDTVPNPRLTHTPNPLTPKPPLEPPA